MSAKKEPVALTAKETQSNELFLHFDRKERLEISRKTFRLLEREINDKSGDLALA